MRMHEDQLHIGVSTVRRLIADQFPQWRDETVSAVDTAGTVNAIFRIGSHLAARFPLRATDSDATLPALEAEAAAIRELAACSTVPVPSPVAIGTAGDGYPLPWSVQTWIPGEVPTSASVATIDSVALDLAAFISGLRSADTRGRRFAGEGRGGDLTGQDAWMETCFRASGGLVDVPALRRLWADLRKLPANGPDVMSHRDLTPANLVVSHWRLTGVLDGGGFGPADPALDLVAAWHLFDADRRLILRDSLGSNDLEWQRGRAWAFAQSMGLVWYYRRSNPGMSRLGLSTLDRVQHAT